MSAPAERVHRDPDAAPQVTPAGGNRYAHHRHRVIPIIAHEARVASASPRT